jgi:VWFA-related protein
MKKILFPLVILGTFGFLTAVFGQQPADTEDVVKITTKLVQVDVVVTNKKGQPVRDLKASDFELLQDGKVQKIVGFTFVPVVTPGEMTSSVEERSKPKADPNIAVPPPARTPLTASTRVIAFLIDDGSCSTSVWGMDSAQKAVKRFINEQMLPTDQVAIYRTRAGSSAFQQYTSDKTTLLKAADKIRWYPPQGLCARSDGSFNEAAKSNVFLKRTSEGAVPITIESEAERKIREYNEDSIARNQIVGALGVFRYAVSGLERVPGRKSMFLLSDGLPLRNRDNSINDAAAALRQLTDAANRAGVVVHTFSLRGSSVPGMIESKDEVYVEDNFNATESISRDRINQETRLNDGLQTLAYDTGGEFYRSSGVPDKLVSRILEKESGYYLLAYEPDENTFKSKKFNSIDVKIKVPELRISHRSGFLANVDTEPVKRRAKSAESDLYDAIAAPLPKAGLGIDLTAYFGVTPTGENFVRSQFHLDGRELTFADEGGQKKAVIDVVAVTMDEKNDVVDEFNRTHTLKFDAATAERIKRDGLIYSTDVPVKKSGSYNFRVAVRDQNSKTLGTAAQIVQIPDLKRSDVFVAGLTVAGVDAAGKFERPGATTAVNAITLPSSEAVPAIRRFKRGSVIAYAYSIYNAKLDKATGKPRLAITVNLYKDGKLVTEGAQNTAEIENQTDWARIQDYAYMRLDANAAPGEYALQIIVRDLLGGKESVSSQSIDLEVVE